MTLDSDRHEKIQAFIAMADQLQADAAWAYKILRTVSSSSTASDEISKTVRALRTYEKELPALRGRRPTGHVAVALPFNNPLYSLVLYSFGVALGGSPVLLRPSSITQHVTQAFADRYREVLDRLKVQVTVEKGADFIQRVIDDRSIQTLIFTGTWANLSNLRSRFPPDKKLIYCGSGINPFIVGRDAFSGPGGANHVVNLAMRSKLYNSGQDCLCAERFYVHADLFSIFVDELVAQLSEAICDDFGSEIAQITPLLNGLAEHLETLVATSTDVEAHLPLRRRGSLMYPSVIEVPLGHPLLKTEKFGPLFVLCKFAADSDLTSELDASHRFGATVCGSYWHELLTTYPHVTSSSSVIEVESEDAHVPFGGCMRSGFVEYRGHTKDGPILYSVETTLPER